MTTRNALSGLALAAVVAAAGSAPAAAQVIANPSFEGGSLAGWTVAGTGQVGPIQAAHLIGGAIPGGVPDGSWFAVLSTTPQTTGTGGTTARIDANTTDEFDIATLSITVAIPFWPAALEFDWTFPSSEQDQPGQFDDLFDVMVYQGAPPADPTVNNRLFARSAPRNVPQDFSNFSNAHFLGTATVNWSINRPGGSPVNGTALRYGAAEFRRACIGIDLPEFPGPPYTRTIRFRVADQGDRQFDSALFLDRVQVVPRCNPAGQLNVAQRTFTAGSEVQLKNGGPVFRPVQGKRLALDPTGRVQAVASNANLDGTTPNFVDQVFIQVDENGWQRVAGLTINDGGEVLALALSGTVGSVPGRYLAIAARRTETDNVELFRWDRNAPGALTTLTATSGCENTNPAVNFGGSVIAFESTCAALTGSGPARKVLLWTGGATNAVNAFQGGGTCVGRAPALNTRSGQDGGYVAFESNCNHTSGNADGNFEIFRYRNSGTVASRFAQITSTVEPVLNSTPQMDRADNASAGNVYFLSNVADTSRGLHVFRYACSNANCTGGTRTQWTDGPETQFYVGFRKLIAPASDAVIDDFIFERLNLASNSVEVGHRIGPTGQENVITIGDAVINLGGGINGTVPVFGFLSNEDLLIGQNADGNREVFTVRVELP
jgi:hypothetical protein